MRLAFREVRRAPVAAHAHRPAGHRRHGVRYRPAGTTYRGGAGGAPAPGGARAPGHGGRRRDR